MDIKDIKDVPAYLRSNWPFFLAAGIFAVPAVYGFFAFLYRHRHEENAARCRTMERERDDALARLAKSAQTTSGSPAPGWICFPKVNAEAQRHLIAQIEGATKQIRIFGLTRNFYARPEMKSLVERRSKDVAIKFFIMHPDCSSRKDRYRVEPMDAAFEAPKRFRTEIEPVFKEMLTRTQAATPQSLSPGLAFYYFDFPCQFSIDQFDDTLRVSFYGLNKQGRESPIWVYNKTEDPVVFEYFVSQLDWVESLAAGHSSEAIKKRKLSIIPLNRDRPKSSPS